MVQFDMTVTNGAPVTFGPVLGYLHTLPNRLKDVIKGGGEWISSIDVENSLVGHPSVRKAAVIGAVDADPKQGQ